MIGQQALCELVDAQIAGNKFPRFSIFVGDDAGERSDLALYCAKALGGEVVTLTTPTVAEIRHVISEAYKVAQTTTYLIEDSDGISSAAKNAMLKVTEEPPNNAYFIMTLSDINTMLDTIRSRAYIYTMEAYTYQQLSSYFNSKYKSEHKAFVLDVCETPGDIDKLEAMCGGHEDVFQDYIELVLNNIASVSIANALKSTERIALKDTDTDKFDLRMFFYGIVNIIVHKVNNDGEIDTALLRKYAGVVQVTKECLALMKRTKSVNKSALLDIWVLDVRKSIEESEELFSGRS